MAIINNTLSEINDTILITPGIPVCGLLTITNYIDSTVGETASRFFIKEFRYSLDTINYSDWQTLSPVNLNAIAINPTYDFMIEYRYTRAGTDPTGLLEFNNVDIQGTYQTKDCGPTFSNSIFAYFFSCCCDTEVLLWCINVLDKIYKPGIVSQSLLRGENQNANQQDRDYIDFWRTITCYFGMIVVYSRKFENFEDDKRLLVKYLRNRGIFICDDQSLPDLLYIMSNFYDEVRQRGTIMITKQKGIDIGGKAKPVDGELLRLICYRSGCDEFLFGLTNIGWNIDRHSPLNRSLARHNGLNKFYEHTKDVLDLTKYPLIDPAKVFLITTGGGISSSIYDVSSVMTIAGVAIGAVAGIGSPIFDNDFAINVDSNIDYQFSFLMKRKTGSNEDVTIKLHGYDEFGFSADLRDVSQPLMPVSNTVFERETTALVNSDFTLITFTLFSKNHIYTNDNTVNQTSIGVGNNLKSSSAVCKIIPEIVLDNTLGGAASGGVYLWDFKMKPLSSDYSTLFVDNKHLIQTWMKNNGQNTNQETEQIMRQYLIPYKSVIKNNFL